MSLDNVSERVKASDLMFKIAFDIRKLVAFS